MSSLVEQVVANLWSLSREEQDRSAEVSLAFLGGFRMFSVDDVNSSRRQARTVVI
jgi:hypothetical protein